MSRIISVIVDKNSLANKIPEIEDEKQKALEDLIADNIFMPKGDSYKAGPYKLHLSITQNARLLLNLKCAETDEEAGDIFIPLNRFRKIVKDYFIICESYFAAVKNHSLAKIEAIDMARRAIHNDGAELLFEQLTSQNIELNIETARRLFTLICVLHIRQEVRE